ncbi:hypothetical protein [Pseudonocardia acaciae]|uniref:hypothetical protein n=1 Tax=Pseudonocardia acaciae TaxID=551276 RepID=UPI0012EE99E9|nr:hypothetical protein [Pseudonocardia acaciae]
MPFRSVTMAAVLVGAGLAVSGGTALAAAPTTHQAPASAQGCGADGTPCGPGKGDTGNGSDDGCGSDGSSCGDKTPYIPGKRPGSSPTD